MNQETIRKILEEIYMIDPSLKAKEDQLLKNIERLIEAKPDVVIDDAFVATLRSQIEAKTTVQTNTTGVSRSKFAFALPQLGLVGALAVLVLVFALPGMFLGDTSNPAGLDLSDPSVAEIIEEDETPIAVDAERGTVTAQKDDGGIVTRAEESGTILAGFIKFGSEQAYKQYLKEAATIGYMGGGSIRGDVVMMESVERATDASFAPTVTADFESSSFSKSTPDRVSETNVQTQGIDEPDILKTDGSEIYFSPNQNYHYIGIGVEPVPMIDVMEADIEVRSDIVHRIPEPPKFETNVIKAYPADEMEVYDSIDRAGDLLLYEDRLVVIEHGALYGFNVSDPKSPVEVWDIALDTRNVYVQARLYGDTIYLVTRTGADRYQPCRIPLFTTAGREIAVHCSDLYHPTTPVAGAMNYHISKIDISDGSLKEGLSFTGSYDNTVYMSKEGLYVAYTYDADLFGLYLDMFKANRDLISDAAYDRLEKLATYDLSNSTKLNEFEVIWSEYLNSLDQDEMLRISNELNDRGTEYLVEHKRSLRKTDIVKIDLDTLKLTAQGTVPGRLLNQFTLDEYEGNLRVAVTVGGGWFRFSGSVEEENDVYVLDENLTELGSVKGLGLTESVFAARFVQDKGYIVTFRQIDPFYVLDLSDPRNPSMEGELKIPGYSSYLHPINKDKIIGIGKENNQVKISLFDVSDPKNPIEADKYMLKEYWSDVLNTHHAFLLDDKFDIFYMPGNSGGYVMSYADDNLSLKTAVSGIQAKRAVFIDDNLYVVGQDKIVVLDENTWERVEELSL